jgi:hypothetical protein
MLLKFRSWHISQSHYFWPVPTRVCSTIMMFTSTCLLLKPTRAVDSHFLLAISHVFSWWATVPHLLRCTLSCLAGLLVVIYFFWFTTICLSAFVGLIDISWTLNYIISPRLCFWQSHSPTSSGSAQPPPINSVTKVSPVDKKMLNPSSPFLSSFTSIDALDESLAYEYLVYIHIYILNIYIYCIYLGLLNPHLLLLESIQLCHRNWSIHHVVPEQRYLGDAAPMTCPVAGWFHSDSIK